MKIEAVKLMRDLRNKMSKEINDISWEVLSNTFSNYFASFSMIGVN